MAAEDAKTPPADDMKERYRQALEAKKHKGGHGESHTSGGGGSKGDSHAAGGKREFRRKSG